MAVNKKRKITAGTKTGFFHGAKIPALIIAAIPKAAKSLP
jgi:hypothetical protein